MGLICQHLRLITGQHTHVTDAVPANARAALVHHLQLQHVTTCPPHVTHQLIGCNHLGPGLQTQKVMQAAVDTGLLFYNQRYKPREGHPEGAYHAEKTAHQTV